MKCPYCNNKMVEGFVLGDRYQVKWAPIENGSFLGIWAKNVRHFLYNHGGIFSRNKSTAYICENCDKLIAELKPKKNNSTY